MKRIGWIAILLSVTLFLAGCGGSDPQESTEVPEIPEEVDAGKVTDAVGKALLKGISSPGGSGQTDPNAP